MLRVVAAALALGSVAKIFADRSPRYDLILDIAGNRPLSRLRRALTPRGTLVIMGGEGGGR
ncbi:NADPH:quinone reductase-like Zn-dependent oxidoreductase [Streptosporangium album]|uniref:NADPH:quinone reductase-like Zn-dependent oxidoreductase n=1 Tax=Streptosporangium album TaxID=47479 RepID=A0A7W7WCB4_9ACTN|nr:hypothetical protein [Streptosporangium album]MBB4941668.1 NADPH:quinone reductase-like Zn-dependent oxidoreductase [Streptosporangium album]